MNRVLKLLPELQGQEMASIQQVMQDMSDEDAESFAHIYRARRKDPQTILILCLAGLFVIPGIQRFYVDQIGMGILYLFTIGLCFIGSIVDLVNYQNLAQEYNSKIVSDVMIVMKANG